ncbi:pantoate--beta-alanine ligase [Metabacillus halosaccharovorans]|uniref:pantoate--beta-alanine ligase n=1 Tax=Metabacillus halosaccharovorans TaxID=930124 RepID=UPI001C1FB6C7|nr:pantoate--beta-alanine ligase [Metabacillus halosaccharovorans]MBU7593271.1 pantoate--beta-alanine ligase [Metabacillus halosaccharovorans]
MIVVETKQDLKDKLESYQSHQTIGFVPTMGFLHEGHVKLIEEAREANDIVVLSIFVNPLQFGPNEDFDSYPRDAERDESIAKQAGVDVLFRPQVDEMYPKKPSYTVSVRNRVNVLCGKSRNGHFDGVATILTKLFHLVQPNRAYFGMKDAQQVAVIDGLINEFHFPIELVPVSTVREENGLAKSSRNVYLNEEERSQAPILYKSLKIAEETILNGERNKQTIIEKVSSLIKTETSGIIDYIEILSYPELKELEVIDGKIIIALAVKFKNARLIDNITIEI